METWSSYIDGLGREDGAAEVLAALRPGFELELVRQPADMGRPFAVAVHRHGVRLGYMPRSDARPIAKLLDQGGHARAFVLAIGYERGLGRRSIKSIALEIEVARAAGAGWAELERPEAADATAAAPPAARRRARIVQGRVAGALCFGVFAAVALANIPASEDEPLASEAELAESAAPDRAAKTQDRPATARGVIARAEAAPLTEPPAMEPATQPVETIARASIAQPGPELIEQEAAEQAAVEPVAAAPEMPAPVSPAPVSPAPDTPPPAVIAQAALVEAAAAEPPVATMPAAVPLPIAAPRETLTVPRPLPRPAIRPTRRR